MSLVTVYFAGLAGSTAQMAPYQKGGILPDKSVQMKYGYHLPDSACLPPLWTGKQPDQIEPYDVLTLESLGIDHNGWLGQTLSWPYRSYVHWKKPEMSIVTPKAIATLPWRINIGQMDDMRHASHYTVQAITEARERGEKVVLFGRSRGSMVALNVFVHLTDEEREHVALVILEGIFWDSGETARARMPRIGPLLLWLAREFGSWDPKGHDAFREQAKTVLPRCKTTIAVIGSRGDEIVPYEQTERLHQFLAQHMPPKQCPLLSLNKATHDRYVYDNKDDSDAYAAFMGMLLNGIKM